MKPLTRADCRGLSVASFFEAASMEAAAASSSFSAMTLGSSGLTQPDPAQMKQIATLHHKPILLPHTMLFDRAPKRTNELRNDYASGGTGTCTQSNQAPP